MIHWWRSNGQEYVGNEKRGRTNYQGKKIQVVEKIFQRKDWQTIQGRDMKQDLNQLHI